MAVWYTISVSSRSLCSCKGREGRNGARSNPTLQIYTYIYIYIHICVCILKCRDRIVVRVLGWDLKVLGSNPADVNYTGYASDTSKSLGECLRLRSNHNLYLNGRLAESNNKNTNIYMYVYCCPFPCFILYVLCEWWMACTCVCVCRSALPSLAYIFLMRVVLA